MVLFFSRATIRVHVGFLVCLLYLFFLPWCFLFSFASLCGDQQKVDQCFWRVACHCVLFLFIDFWLVVVLSFVFLFLRFFFLLFSWAQKRWISLELCSGFRPCSRWHSWFFFAFSRPARVFPCLVAFLGQKTQVDQCFRYCFRSCVRASGPCV